MNIENIKKVDPVVAEQIEKEFERQQNTIELIASENITSEAVMEACGSVLTNKYAEGKPHKRFYNGCEYVDVIEEVAQKRACELFKMDHANVQPHSGAHLDHIPAVEVEIEFHTAQQRIIPFPDAFVVGSIFAQGMFPAVGILRLFQDT